MDDSGPDAEQVAQCAHLGAVVGRWRRGAPHARARRENLKSIRTDIVRALSSLEGPTGNTQVHADGAGVFRRILYGGLCN